MFSLWNKLAARPDQDSKHYLILADLISEVSQKSKNITRISTIHSAHFKQKSQIETA